MTSITPAYPQDFQHYFPMEVRFADIDSQSHVNNVAIMVYVESARTRYYQESGTWDGKDMSDLGVVVASIQCDYLEPILYGQEIRVGMKVARIGNKSLRYRFQVESADGQTAFARGEYVVVAYDHAAGRARVVPKAWRERIAAYEKNEELLA